MRRLIPFLLSLVMLTAACGDDASPTEAGVPGEGSTTTTTSTTAAPADPDTPEWQLAAARARWAEHGLIYYQLTTAELCFCPQTQWMNTVVEGVVVDHQPTTDDAFFDPGARSMDTLFDEIEAAIAEGYETLEAEYDPETGAVIRYWVDVAANIADEEHGVEVIALTPFDVNEPEIDVEAAALVDDYGCGFGFAKGNADQSLGLIIFSEAGYQEQGPDLSAPIVLPSPDWNATLQTGRDLFANWCDDVLEPDEPTPEVTATWTLVSGTITATTDTPEGGCAGADVAATLSGAVVESPEGQQIPLDDITLVNTAWGCFAG